MKLFNKGQKVKLLNHVGNLVYSLDGKMTIVNENGILVEYKSHGQVHEVVVPVGYSFDLIDGIPLLGMENGALIASGLFYKYEITDVGISNFFRGRCCEQLTVSLSGKKKPDMLKSILLVGCAVLLVYVLYANDAFGPKNNDEPLNENNPQVLVW